MFICLLHSMGTGFSYSLPSPVSSVTTPPTTMADNRIMILKDKENSAVAGTIAIALNQKSELPQYAARYIWQAIAKQALGSDFLEDNFLRNHVFDFQAFLTKMDFQAALTMTQLLRSIQQHLPSEFFQCKWPVGFLAKYGIHPPVSGKPLLPTILDLAAERNKITRLLPKAKYPLMIVDRGQYASEDDRDAIIVTILRKASMAQGYGGRSVWEVVGQLLLGATYDESNFLEKGKFALKPWVLALHAKGVNFTRFFTDAKPSLSRTDYETLYNAVFNTELIPREEEEGEEEEDSMDIEEVAAAPAYDKDAVPVEYYGHMSTWAAPTPIKDDDAVPQEYQCSMCTVNYVGAWIKQCPHGVCRDCAVMHSEHFRSNGKDVTCPKGCGAIVRQWYRKH